MKTAAIYCRVSTEDQEREGTSLQTQLEACLKYCQDRGYDVAHRFSEAYSGLTLERPKLNELRELVRAGDIDVSVVYCLDRLSRDPVHFIIVQDEMEKHGVELVLVTETIDSSDLGKLIMHVKGYAAKVEAQKILERTTRGRRERVKAGKLPTGRGILFGYDYDRQTGKNIANSSLDTVRMVGRWILEDGIFLNEACRRLMKANISAPKGGLRWSRGTLGRIFRNPTYAGKSQAYKTKTLPGQKRRANDAEKLVEIPNAVDRAAFTWNEWLGIQRQLDRNRELSPRNQKLAYLLKGMMFCKRDGRKYYGVPMHGRPYYRCSGRNPLLSSITCNSRTVSGKWLEDMVWLEVKKVLMNPEMILAELEKRREEGTESTHLEERIRLDCSRLNTIDEAETRYLRLYGAGLMSDDKLGEECKRIKQERTRLEHEIAELKHRIEKSKEMVLTVESIERVCELATKNLEELAFEGKRWALEALNIKVWVDGESFMIEGNLPLPDMQYASQPS